MGQTVVTTLQIDADTSGAGVFSQAMQGAEDVTKSTMLAVAGVGKEFGVLTTAIIGGGGVIAALVGLGEFVKSQNKDLADMGMIARQVGLTLADFQGIKFGGAIAGLSTDQINSGLEKSASLLNDASRNSNSLSKELEKNGISIKNSNGQLISENQLLGIAAGLVSNAKNPGDELAIAQMLGFTKEWIPLLEQGSGAMAGLTDQAKAAGAVIDDATIAKATDFDAAWRKSSVEWSAYMKAAIADMLPGIDDLIQRGATFLQQVKNRGGGVDGVVKAAADAALNSVGIDPQAGIQLTISPKVTSSWENFTTEVGKAKDLLVWLANDPNITEFLRSSAAPSASTPKPLFGLSTYGAPYPVSQDPMNSDAYPKNLGPADGAALQKQTDWEQDALGDAADKFSKVVGDKVVTAYSRANDALQKYIETSNAGAASAGQGIEQQEKLKAVADLTAAGLKDGLTPAVAKANAELSKIPDLAGAAALALAKANTAANIKFSGDTALLTPGDAAIAQTLKGQYNSVAESLDTAEAAQIRFNKSLKDVSTSFQTDAGNAFLDFETGAKSGGAAMADFEKQFTRSILNMVNQMIILAPIAKAFQGLLTGGIDLTSFGFNPIKGVTGSAHGNIFDGSNIIPFAHGGIVDDPTLFKFANGTGLMGEAGPEAIVPLKRGADGNLGIASQGGSSGNTVIVNTYPTENSQVETRTSRNSNGQTVIDLIHSTVDQKMGSGGYDKTLAARYGVRPQARSR